jgi:GMP synthase - Glutamine amidotransferase domain
MSKVLIIQNAALFTAGSFEEELKRREIPFEYRRLYEGEKLPGIEQAKDFSGYIVLGGPLRFRVEAAEKASKRNWVAEELFFLRACLDQHKPIFGVSQGGVLLARAQGASIKKLEHKEVGWVTGEIYPDYSRNSVIYSQIEEKKFPALMWTDAMSGFPPEGYWYCLSPTCRYLSVGIHGNCYAFNFHPEITEELLQAWVKEYSHDLASKEDAARILTQAPEHMAFNRSLSRKIIHAFQSFLK